MATPQRNAENVLKKEDDTMEHTDSFQKSLLQSLPVKDSTKTGMLQSRTDEHSGLICMLKHRTDEMLLGCEALQKISTELESCTQEYKTELESERKKADLIESRFKDLANNNQAIIAFMEEYKSENSVLKQENKQLQAENDTLFSQKLQDKEVCVQNLQQEIKELTEKYTKKENEYREKLADYQSELQDTKQQHKDAEEMCRDLKLKLHTAVKEHAQREVKLRESITNLTEKKENLLQLSMERGKLIEEKQEETQQLEMGWKEEKMARAKAEKRFQTEAEAVNADLKVMSLQSALDEEKNKYRQLKREFEAYREHSTNLLTQEKELNKIYRRFKS